MRGLGPCEEKEVFRVMGGRRCEGGGLVGAFSCQNEGREDHEEGVLGSIMRVCEALEGGWGSL